MIKGDITKARMESWRYSSPEEYGLHEVISPKHSDCDEVSVYRLNLKEGEKYILETDDKEMNPVCIKGSAYVDCKEFQVLCNKYDSFYLTSKMKISISAKEDSTFYIGAAIDEGYGKPFFRKCDLTLPIGEIHQVHGSGVSQREVFMTVNPEIQASRLLCGITWGGNGSWTSWPPHQHENDLEEVYCYFDMDEPHFGIHLSYVNPGNVESLVAHIVKSGIMVLAPMGYHPTVAAPGTNNTYFWILAAHSHKSRRYDLAILDPTMDDMN